MRIVKEGSSACTRLEPVVLIAQSDPSARDWIEAIAATTGLRVRSFASAHELLSHLSDDTASCAILEVHHAEPQSFELQSSLARAGATVLVVTREQSISACVRALKAGAVDFLSMPCEAIELVRALRDAVREAVNRWHQHKRLVELKARYAQLTLRERQVLALVVSGLLNKQAAHVLDISEITVQVHRRRAMRKMGARTLPALVRMADQLQLQAEECAALIDPQCARSASQTES